MENYNDAFSDYGYVETHLFFNPLIHVEYTKLLLF